MRNPVGSRTGLRLLTAAAVACALLGLSWTQPSLASADTADRSAPSPFDVADPAVGQLDPALLSALQSAATAASAEGIIMTVTSGWRSPEFQQQLLDDAVLNYGSYAAARRYVQTPTASKHVIGQAVDIGGPSADEWLINNGARFGLCQIYANERWHFELATDAYGNCPALLPNAAG